jgi:Immunity protein 41
VDKNRKRKIKDHSRDSSLRIVEDNANCREGSLVEAMGDRDVFSEKAFWDYYNALVTLTAAQKKGRPLRRKEAQAVFISYSMILQLFIYHLSPKDLCRIRRFPLANLHLYMERLHLAVQGYFWAHVFEEELFDRELKNPGIAP